MDKFNSRYPYYNDDSDYTTNAPSYYDDLARKNKLIEYLSKRIWEYDKELAKRFDEWDKNISEFPDEVLKLLREWIETGVIAHEVIDFLLPTHVYTYRTYLEMTNDTTLNPGNFTRTLGYYEPGDYGGANYIVENDGFKNVTSEKNIVMYGADPKGIIPSDNAILKGFQDTDTLLVPPFMFTVTDSVRVRSNQELVGMSSGTWGNEKGSGFIYKGSKNRKKAVLHLGNNEIDAIPNNSSINVNVRNLTVDANNLAGFGVYGTYISGESRVEKIVNMNATEHGQYYAYSWYSRFINLTSFRSEYQGISLGMPLRYSNGDLIEWNVTYELNLCKIDNIRSLRSGIRYENITWNKLNITDLLGGYGVGVGVGNGMVVENIVSERSGGINIVNYTGAQPTKVIRNFYIENTQTFSAIPNNEKIGLLNYFGTNGHTGGSIHVEDGFINFNNGGQVGLSGVSGREVFLKNINQQSGNIQLIDYDIPEDLDPLHYVRGRDFGGHLFNQNPKDHRVVYQGIVNTSGHWKDIHLKPGSSMTRLYLRKVNEDDVPLDFITYWDRFDRRVDVDLQRYDLTTDFKFIRNIGGQVKKIVRGGSASNVDADGFIEILIVESVLA